MDGGVAGTAIHADLAAGAARALVFLDRRTCRRSRASRSTPAARHARSTRCAPPAPRWRCGYSAAASRTADLMDPQRCRRRSRSGTLQASEDAGELAGFSARLERVRCKRRVACAPATAAARPRPAGASRAPGAILRCPGLDLERSSTMAHRPHTRARSPSSSPASSSAPAPMRLMPRNVCVSSAVAVREINWAHEQRGRAAPARASAAWTPGPDAGSAGARRQAVAEVVAVRRGLSSAVHGPGAAVTAGVPA